MNADKPNPLSVVTNPTFREMLLASVLLMPFRIWFIVVYALLALFGVFLLTTPFTTGNPLGPIEVTLGLFCIFFLPGLIVLGVWGSRRRGKLSEGPFTYSFDAEGMHTTGSAFSQTIQWSAIPRVRLTKRFLFVFFAPRRALTIPAKDLPDPDFFERLQMLAGENTKFECA